MPKELRAMTSRRTSPMEASHAPQHLPVANPRTAAVWNDADDQILVAARASGLNWQPIASRHFPSKTANACRKRHERLMERRNNEDWDGRKLDALAKEYMECRKEIWSMLAAKLGERWAVIEAKYERQCMEKGLKNLQAIARAAHKRAVATDRAHQRGRQGYHEGDSGIGCSDEDAEMEAGDGGKTASATSGAPPLRPTQHKDEPPEHQANPLLPLYQPPAPAVGRASGTERSLDDPMFGGVPFMREQQSRTPDDQAHRGVSIRSMLSHT